jgi:orotate phosphoribosyltransferase
LIHTLFKCSFDNIILTRITQFINMNYRSLEDLNRAITNNLAKVPLETDLIVGVPRSGLLAANLLALHLNLPFTDVEGFLEGRILQSGERLKNYIKPFSEYNNVLIVEDSIYSGSSVKMVKEKLNGLTKGKNLLYAAVFAVPESRNQVDIYFEVCPVPRIFEWNMMHHNLLSRSCVNIDGVLCKDPTEDENDHGSNYEYFLENVEPFFRSSKTIGFLVTNRLEKYRTLTEAWLAKHNVKYNTLIMLNLPNEAARLKANNHGEFKADVYIKSNCVLFIESSLWQSRQIASLSGKPVYCMDERKMIYPNFTAKGKYLINKLKIRLFGDKDRKDIC